MLLLDDLQNLALATATQEQVLTPDSVRQGARQMIEYARTDPEGFWQIFVEKATQFGIKVLAALLIFIIGIFLVRWAKNALKRMFLRRKTEPTIASFVTSFASISLTVLLIVVTVSALAWIQLLWLHCWQQAVWR